MGHCIDEVCKHLTAANEEWTSVTELTELVSQCGVTPNKMADVLAFLTKYFLEFNNSKQKVRVNAWTSDLFS